MANEERKIQYGIKGKLISAIAMLLVAVIMTVSSTYAWFTLSTAPEVTGISTAVGANGALEMLLLTKTEDGQWCYITSADVFGDKNTTWGNLVDLSGSLGKDYGSSAIVLYPSVLNTEAGAGKISPSNPLSFPQYGTDGRVSALSNNSLLSGHYNGSTKDFKVDDSYGFRAVGSSTGMTPRQIAHRAAYSNVSNLMNGALNKAKSSLENNGSALAMIAIIEAMKDGYDYTSEHVEVIGAMINDLKPALADIDAAYQQAILAWAASGMYGMDKTDVLFEAVQTIVNDDDQYQTVDAVEAAVETKITELVSELQAAGLSLPTGLSLTIPTEITTGIDKYLATLDDVNDAETEYKTLKTAAKAEYSFSELSKALTPLVNIDKIMVNGFKVTEKDKIVSSVMSSGILVTMPGETTRGANDGGGVYADIADQCGNYKVGINIDGDMIMPGIGTINAYMDATTKLSPVYLAHAIAESKNAKPEGTTEEQYLSEFYGYIIDLAFRTNAAQSNLLLQQDAIDRIYEDNNNEGTMGHGSSMTFETGSNTFTKEQLLGLMGHIRVVFFNPDDSTIYATAKLDVDADNVTASNNGWTAKMYLYETVPAYKVTVDGETQYLFAVQTGTTTSEDQTVNTYSFYNDYYTQDDTTLVYANIAESSSEYAQYTAERVDKYEVVKEDRIITSLTQNEAKHVSALVYLDGTTIENKDVAADAVQSMFGTANFQFASDANLKPMEYGDLYTPNAPEANP